MATSKTKSGSSSHLLTEHAAIIAWAEQRGGQPARVVGTAENNPDSGILRFDFGAPDERLEPIDWDMFFEIFEDRGLALLVQDETSEGQQSRFNKFVSRHDEA